MVGVVEVLLLLLRLAVLRRRQKRSQLRRKKKRKSLMRIWVSVCLIRELYQRIADYEDD